MPVRPFPSRLTTSPMTMPGEGKLVIAQVATPVAATEAAAGAIERHCQPARFTPQERKRL